MFNNYTSLKDQIQKEIENQKSVLNKFPEHISRPIAQSCSKYLSQFTTFQLPFKEQPSESVAQADTLSLDTAEQVNWILENLMYGLQLSHEHQDIIKDCWNIYHEWLSILLDEQKIFLPQPIRDNPGQYFKKMLWHLYHLFVARPSNPPPTKHIMMCHGVLMLIETIAKDSKLLDRDLWEELLKFLLAINNAVLSPPFQKEDFCHILSTRIIATLFEIWLIACHKMFPNPSLWKTFQDMCSGWRHHMSLVTEWSRVCNALTVRLLELFWNVENRRVAMSPVISADTNVQFNIQNLINSMNKEQVVQSWYRFLHIIGKPIDFMDGVLMQKNFDKKNSFELSQQTTIASQCVKKLPLIHLEYLKSVSNLIDLYLKTTVRSCSVNSLLDMFGVWLFETLSVAKSDFVLGQAEAYGCLSKIFCSLNTNECVNIDYLAKFYALLLNGLKQPLNDDFESCELLFSIVYNCSAIFRKDLNGCAVLLGPFLNAIQFIFKLKYTQKEDKIVIGARTITLIELKRCSINLFSQIISFNLNEHKARVLEIYLSGTSTEVDYVNLQLLFACGKLLIGEWVLDEIKNKQLVDKKDKALYCYNQIVSLICAPLKVNSQALHNHSFALCIFDCLTSIISADYLGLLNENDTQIAKLAISWIWHYIQSQIKRRSRDHTKEMHSVICSAYQCLICILITKPDVLRDKTTLQTITNCIEIGISGSNSQNDNEIVLKWDKELRPASLRVKEAAECVLFYMMEQSFQSNDLRQPLTEKEFSDTNTQWKYYALEGQVLISVLDRQLLEKSSTMSKLTPQIVVVSRTAFGRQAWLMNQRQSSLAKMDKQIDINYKLNKNTDDVFEPSKKIFKTESFLSESQNVPKCEQSVPSIGEISCKLYKQVLSKFDKLKKDQIDLENASARHILEANKDVKIFGQLDESLKTKNCADFVTSSRMFLANLGLLKQDSKLSGEFYELTNMIECVQDLDNLATRTYCQAYIFYVRANLTSTKSILESTNTKLTNDFYSFVHSLGSVVSNDEDDKKCLNQLNGTDSLIYWSDFCNELSFVLPNGSAATQTSDIFKSKTQTLPTDLKVLIIWLEQTQDSQKLPTDELAQETEYLLVNNLPSNKPKEIVCIYVQPLRNKLNRISISNSLYKKYYYTMPLIDGMIVSSRMLSSMIRQTVLSIFRRKRLEIDDYQPPHVRRKNKIAEIIKKNQVKKFEPDLYTSFLMGV